MNASDHKGERVVFAISDEGTGDDVPVVILGVPEAAWTRMKTGLTETFDLNRAGLPVKIVLFGGKSQEEIERLLLSIAQPGAFRPGDFGITP